MSDFTAARPAHEAHFSHAEWREVVVQHEAFRRLTRLEQLDALFVIFRAEGHRYQGLRFTTSEDGRSVRPRKHAGLNCYGPDLVELASVRPPVLFEHFVAENPLFQQIVKFGGFFLLLLRQRLQNFLLQLGDLAIAFQFWIFLRVQSVGEVLTKLLGNLVVQRLIDGGRRKGSLRLPDLLDYVVNDSAHLAAALVAKFDRADHIVFRGLLRAGLHHHDATLGARNNNVQF